VFSLHSVRTPTRATCALSLLAGFLAVLLSGVGMAPGLPHLTLLHISYMPGDSGLSPLDMPPMGTIFLFLLYVLPDPLFSSSPPLFSPLSP
jgi:hypothetical protein